MDMNQIMKLFRLLHLLCRRPIMSAALNTSLPFFFRPTLLLNIPRVSTSVGGFWRASNYRGAVVPGPQGTVRNVGCAKVVFCETEAARRAWAPEAVHIPLLPTSQEFPSLSELEEAQLAAEYQPQLLMFRLRNLSLMYQSDVSSCRPSFAGFAPGGSLPACLTEDPEILKALTPLADSHAQDLLATRVLDPHVAIVESVWAASHKEKEMSTDEITNRVSALLWERGQRFRYNSREIGWKLRNLGLSRQNNGKCKVVRFSHEMRLRIHQLAAQFGLQLPKIVDCKDCKRTQLTKQE
jgi:hypothetical protein